MINIQIEPPFDGKVSSDLVERTALEAIAIRSEMATAEASIVVTTDEQVHDLNLQYRGIDSPTDVLSFPSGDVDPDSGNVYLGDILISYPRALEQAGKGGHSVDAEIQLLVVHGILHLLGFDHAEPAEKQQMWDQQARILEKLGSQLRYPPE